MEETKQVVFKLGQEEYGLDILVVNAIEPCSSVVPVPNSPDYILGILNLRGEVIPVFSLHVKFGVPENYEGTQKLVIIKNNGMQIGFKVDEVCGIVDFDAKELSEVPQIVKTEKTKYAKKVANKDGKMIILLDHEGILNDKEQESIQGVLADN